MEKSGIHQVSIEDAEAKNDLDALLPNFKNMTVILGAITIARSKIEELYPDIIFKIQDEDISGY